jgi:GGDEF domain-containing protein
VGVESFVASAAGAGVLDRSALFRALADAVRPDSPSSVLVVVGFEGLKDYLEASLGDEGDELLDRLAQRLVETVEAAGAIYASRRGEFCILCEGGLAAVRTTLALLPPELDDLARGHDVRTALGITLLPDEATLPTYALALADRRIRALSGETRAKVR